MKKKTWIFISGLIWFAVGLSLLYKGLRFISEGTMTAGSICDRFKGTFGSAQQSGTVIVAIALLIGFAKGRFVLSKTVQRVVGRIRSLPEPIAFGDVYARSYWIIIGSMALLGLTMKYLPIPVDLRGFVDTAVGAALMNGAMLYFRANRTAPANS